MIARGLGAAVLTAVAALAVAVPVAAKTHTVNTTGDGADVALDGKCDADAAVEGKQCTLRAAIQEANDVAGLDDIHFGIAGSGVHRIRPDNGLPILTGPVNVDGYTQPGASVNTKAKGTNAVLLVWLDGRDAGSDVDGLVLSGGGSTVRGLVITGWNDNTGSGGEGHGVFMPNIGGNTNNVIAGNFVGTDPTGTVAKQNDGDGVFATGASTGNTIGGSALADRNLLSGNGDPGAGVVSASNTVQGNLIGTDASGTQELPNHGPGVLVNASGGNNSVLDNTIAFNLGDAVTVFNGSGHAIRGNSIFLNDGLPIDLGANDRTLNDGGAADDADTGPNGLQNFPIVTSAFTSAGTTTVGLFLDSVPSQTFTIDVYSGPPGTFEGKKPLGQVSLVTNASGTGTATLTAPGPGPAAGDSVTATATGPTNNTSEFSDPRRLRTVS
jgi:CSLREA domain-containing protein